MEKPSVYSSRTILLITIAVAVVLVVVVWPLSQLGKGDAASDGSADEASVRAVIRRQPALAGVWRRPDREREDRRIETRPGHLNFKPC